MLICLNNGVADVLNFEQLILYVNNIMNRRGHGTAPCHTNNTYTCSVRLLSMYIILYFVLQRPHICKIIINYVKYTGRVQESREDQVRN